MFPITKINKIVMHGFKSFAKHTEFLFGNNFNVVIGPNGSGKSNLLDGLCFVLGKSSAKSMRAEKSSHLIYNGGKTKKPAKHGEVSIFFDNSKNIFPTQEGEVKVTRVVRHNGQSLYKINDNIRTRQQIVELLNMAKIDPDGYNIILQGDIVRFVEMSPIERRMLIEEISGISVYEEKKQKALLQMQKVEEKLKEADIVLAERKRHLTELKRDRDQALHYQEMSNKVKESQASLLKLQIDRKTKEIEAMKKSKESLQAQLEKINEKIRQLQDDNVTKRNSIEDTNKEIEQKGEVEQVRLNKEIEALKIELTRKQARQETISNEITKISQRKVSLKGDMGEISRNIEQLGKEKASLKERISANDKEKELFLRKIKAFKEKHNLESVHGIEKQLGDIDKKADDMQKEAHGLKEQEHNLIRNKDRLEMELRSLDATMLKIRQIEKEHRDQIQELKKKREGFKAATLELNKKLDEDSSLVAQLDAARKKLSHANESIARLKAREAHVTETRLSNVAIKKVLEQRDSRKGIYGTVAELGDVKAAYALALEVAAGPRIKSIIVEDDNVASELIKYLKQQKLGIATFLPLNKLKAKQTSHEIIALSKAKGCHGLAVELVEYDPKFKKIFSYVFSDTLVVDDIDVARRLGIGNAKFVTLDGDLAEMSGVMQGGYREKAKAGMHFREKELGKDINEYAEIISMMESTIKNLEQKRTDLGSSINELRVRKSTLEGEAIKLEKSLHLEEGESEINIKKKNELEREIKLVEQSLQGSVEKLSIKNRELADIKTQKQNLRNEILQLRDPSKLAELNAFEQKVRELSEHSILATAELKNIENQIQLQGQEKERINAITRQAEKEEESFKKEKQELVQALRHFETVLVDKEKQATAFRAKYRDLFEKKGKIEAEVTRNDASILQKTNDSRQVEISLNTTTLKYAEAASQLAGLEQEYSNYEGVPLHPGRSEEELKAELKKFEKLKEDIGTVNLKALEIYGEIEKEYNGLLEKKEKLHKEQQDVMGMMNEIEGRKKELFMKEFLLLNKHFQNTFSSLTAKGEASLVLENPESPFEAGLRIIVKITGSKFLDIRSLSGGEKTLTALAFIFSIQEHDPASFYIFDEVDAALDKHNSEKLAKLIRKYSEQAQYVIISHNDALIGEADTLYGVSMGEHGMSRVVSLKV